MPDKMLLGTQLHGNRMTLCCSRYLQDLYNVAGISEDRIFRHPTRGESKPHSDLFGVIFQS